MLLGEDRAAGVGRVVHDDARRVVVDEALQVAQGDLPAALRLRVGRRRATDQRAATRAHELPAVRDRHPPWQAYHQVVEARLHLVGVADDLVEREARPRHEDVLARVGKHGDGQLDGAGAAAGDDDVLRRHRRARPRVHAGDGGARRLVAVGGWVPVVLERVQRLDQRGRRRLGRLEVAKDRRVAYAAGRQGWAWAQRGELSAGALRGVSPSAGRGEGGGDACVPMEREIMGLSEFGVTFMWSTMARIGLLVRAAMCDMGTGAHSALAAARRDDVMASHAGGRLLGRPHGARYVGNDLARRAGGQRRACSGRR